MKSAIAILAASLFAVSAFAQAPAKKEEAKPTAPAVTTMTNFYNVNPAATSGATTIVTAIPATGIYVDGVSSKFAVQVARDNSSPITAAAGQDALKIRVSTGVAGAKITATGTAGVWFLGSASLAAASRSQYTDADGHAYFVVGSTTRQQRSRKLPPRSYVKGTNHSYGR